MFTAEDYYGGSLASGIGRIQSVAVRISAGEDSAFRTAPVPVNQLPGEPCALQWHEGKRGLRVNRGVANLSGQVLARIERRSSRDNGQGRTPPAEGTTTVGAAEAPKESKSATEIVLASAFMNVDSARDGYNYVQLFSPDRNSHEDGGSTSLGEGGTLEREREDATEVGGRLMGQLVLRLKWVESGHEGFERAGRHAALVIHGASGLAKADL